MFPPVSLSRELHIAFRGTIVLLFIVGFILYRVLLPLQNPACIYDAYLTATLAANRELAVDPSSAAFEGNSNALTVAGMAFIGTGQVLMDLWIAVLGIIWYSVLDAG